MTKKEALDVLGRPDTTRSPGGGVEILCYRLTRARPPLKFSLVEEYFVKVVDGKVDSYGEKGDSVDPTKDPTLNLNIKNK